MCIRLDICAVDNVPPTDFWTEASMWVGLTIMWPAAFRMTRCPGRLYRNNILPSRVTTSCAAHCWLHSLIHSCIHRATLGSGLYFSYWLPERAFSPKYAGQKKRKEKKRKEKKRKEKKRKEKKRKDPAFQGSVRAVHSTRLSGNKFSLWLQQHHHSMQTMLSQTAVESLECIGHETDQHHNQQN